MKLSELKECEKISLQKRIHGWKRKNKKYYLDKLNQINNEIDAKIKKYGDIDAGMLFVIGCLSGRLLSSYCANAMLEDLKNKYGDDLEKFIKAEEEFLNKYIRKFEK